MTTNTNITTVLPPQQIGIIGGGQLGRMMAIDARYMGYQVIVLDPTPNCPTAQVADEQIVAAYDDMEAIKELTAKSDVVTYEFENVDLTAATYIESQGKLPQGAYALEVTQNREKEKNVAQQRGLNVPPFQIVTSGEECEQVLQHFSFPCVIKTCSGGYDGKGQLKLTSEQDIPEAKTFAERDGRFIIEQWIPFDKEISVVFSRTQAGEMHFFPTAENDHRDHILYQTIAPAKVSRELVEKAREAATALAEEIAVVGTFAIEMFVQEEDVYINEMAPRPHNSGHYTIESCSISQFGAHIRAICGLPIPSIDQLQPAVMINVLGEDMSKAINALTNHPRGHVHLYGKDEAKTKRKMGHITFIADSEAVVMKEAMAYEEEEHD